MNLNKSNIQNRDIFISYSHQDNKCANAIARFLDKNGYNVWIDSDNLSLGQNWTSNIDEALQKVNKVIAIISANSIRRKEVLREIGTSLNRFNSGEENFKLYFIVIGKIHPSWFSNQKSKITKEILDYLEKYQYLQLDPQGSITLSFMIQLLEELNDSNFKIKLNHSNENNSYINQNGNPTKVYDNKGDNYFYKVRSNDLAPSAVFPFTLDNQWAPEIFLRKSSKYHQLFLSKGFSDPKIKEYLNKYQKENFYLSLFHSKQLIVNRASILNCEFIRNFYLKKDISKTNSNFNAFIDLLTSGALVIFLYGKNETTPFVNELPNYSIELKAAQSWNEICKKFPIYCIREDWDNLKDKHSIELLKFCSTLSLDRDKNLMIIKNFNFDNIQKKEFLKILKQIEIQVFTQTRINGLFNETNISNYSRSNFYKDFIVRNSNECNMDPVLNCLLDNKNKYCIYLKKLIDVFYNSMFVNFFDCWFNMPTDSKPEDWFINQLYLPHGNEEVSLGELEYALTDFFEENKMFDLISSINQGIYLKNWNLEQILKLRKTNSWNYYIELLENITNRSKHWEIDFSEIELLITQFLESIFLIRDEEFDPIDEKDLAFSFRICIGSKILDLVSTPKVNKLKEYSGSYNPKSQNELRVQFQVGDLTKETANQMIFQPITLFDGKTDYSGGEIYYSKLTSFLENQLNFLWID